MRTTTSKRSIAGRTPTAGVAGSFEVVERMYVQTDGQRCRRLSYRMYCGLVMMSFGVGPFLPRKGAVRLFTDKGLVEGDPSLVPRCRLIP
jgi:hypothetical protein